MVIQSQVVGFKNTYIWYKQYYSDFSRLYLYVCVLIYVAIFIKQQGTINLKGSEVTHTHHMTGNIWHFFLVYLIFAWHTHLQFYLLLWMWWSPQFLFRLITLWCFHNTNSLSIHVFVYISVDTIICYCEEDYNKHGCAFICVICWFLFSWVGRHPIVVCLDNIVVPFYALTFLIINFIFWDYNIITPFYLSHGCLQIFLFTPPFSLSNSQLLIFIKYC